MTVAKARRIRLAKVEGGELERLIHAAADRLEPEIRQAFIEAVEAMRQAIPLGELAEAFDAGDLLAISRAVGNLNLPPELRTTVTDAVAAAAQQTGTATAASFVMSFDAVNERAVRYAADTAARLVTNIQEDVRSAIRDVIVTGQRGNLTVWQQARQIRQMVGLTQRDSRAVLRISEGMAEDEFGMRDIDRITSRMSTRLLRRRAENIARTETIRAANMGTQLGWEAAADQGLLPQTTRKVWIATEDSRTCPICAVLDGQTVAMPTTFDVSEQATSFNVSGDTISVAETKPLARPTTTRTPPAHPSCRCTVALVFD